jgi:hypothetical protein
MGRCGVVSSERDRNQWQVVVNTVMNLRVPKKAGNSLPS